MDEFAPESHAILAIAWSDGGFSATLRPDGHQRSVRGVVREGLREPGVGVRPRPDSRPAPASGGVRRCLATSGGVRLTESSVRNNVRLGAPTRIK